LSQTIRLSELPLWFMGSLSVLRWEIGAVKDEEMLGEVGWGVEVGLGVEKGLGEGLEMGLGLGLEMEMGLGMGGVKGMDGGGDVGGVVAVGRVLGAMGRALGVIWCRSPRSCVLAL